MPLTILALTAAFLYLAATGLQLLHIAQKRTQVDRSVLTLALLALLCHAIVAFGSVFTTAGVDLGFFKVSALIFLMVNLACVASLTRRPLQNLLVALFPLAAISVLVCAFTPASAIVDSRPPAGVLVHIIASILAYSVLTLAAVQAGLLALQDHHLRHRQTRGLVQILPPLQLMETMLFELVWVGVGLLTVSIASGIFFVDDIFAQHMVHKTVLTLAAWLLFSTLLWGRYQLGWRSQTAVRFTLAGFALLMLGYFGSKAVLELVLKRG